MSLCLLVRLSIRTFFPLVRLSFRTFVPLGDLSVYRISHTECLFEILIHTQKSILIAAEKITISPTYRFKMTRRVSYNRNKIPEI